MWQTGLTPRRGEPSAAMCSRVTPDFARGSRGWRRYGGSCDGAWWLSREAARVTGFSVLADRLPFQERQPAVDLGIHCPSLLLSHLPRGPANLAAAKAIGC